MVLEAGHNGVRTIVVRPGHRLRRLARHRVGSAEGRAERPDARDRPGQEPLADASTIATSADLYVRLVQSPDARGVFHANDEADERVNDIVEAIAEHLTQRPDIRHVPLPEARRKLGTYADALALDQRVRSPRARALGWAPSLSSITANVPRLFEEYRRGGRLQVRRLAASRSAAAGSAASPPAGLGRSASRPRSA